MANTIRDYSATAASNTVVDGADISEGCSPAGINDAIRGVMADLKDVSTGAVALESPAADSLTVTGNVGAATFSGDGSALTGIPTPTLTSLGIANHDDITVNGSGNVGISTSTALTGPSAATALRIGNQINIYEYDDGSNPVQMNINQNIDANENYITTDHAARYQMRDGVHKWFTTGSGTAGTATNIGAGEAMQLDTSGNVGIGVTAGTRLDVGDASSNTVARIRNLSGGGTNTNASLQLSTSNNYVNLTLNELYNYSQFQHAGNLVNHYSDVDNHYFRTKSGTYTLMTIDSSGRVTMPYQPAFRAILITSPNTVGNYLVFETVDYNIGNHYNSSTGVFTAPVAGRYMVSVQGFNENTQNSQLYVQVNNVNKSYSLSYAGPSGSNQYNMMSHSSIFNLSANDTVRVYCNAGEIYVSTVDSNSFSCYLLG